MAIFRRLYDKVLSWSSHQHAPYYLAGVSFIESSFFPIPPDVMLVPMALSKPAKTFQYAVITIVASILGGILGYALGYYAFELIGIPLIHTLKLQVAYDKVVEWFGHYGFWAVLIAGFTPIPYKIFTIAAGVSQMTLFPFIAASIIGRGIRFFLVATVLHFYGKKLESIMIRYIEILGWLIVFLLMFGSILYYFW